MEDFRVLEEDMGITDYKILEMICSELENMALTAVTSADQMSTLPGSVFQ